MIQIFLDILQKRKPLAVTVVISHLRIYPILNVTCEFPYERSPTAVTYAMIRYH